MRYHKEFCQFINLVLKDNVYTSDTLQIYKYDTTMSLIESIYVMYWPYYIVVHDLIQIDMSDTFSIIHVLFLVEV